MAANLQNSRGLANLGKRLAAQTRSRDSAAVSHLSRRCRICYSHPLSSMELFCPRSVQASAYDKNPEENVNPTLVPDHLIPPQSEEYWAPHPKTGVFGPAADENPDTVSESGADGDGGSVLEEKTFFRPLEDLEKPPVQP